MDRGGATESWCSPDLQNPDQARSSSPGHSSGTPRRHAGMSQGPAAVQCVSTSRYAFAARHLQVIRVRSRPCRSSRRACWPHDVGSGGRAERRPLHGPVEQLIHLLRLDMDETVFSAGETWDGMVWRGHREVQRCMLLAWRCGYPVLRSLCCISKPSRRGTRRIRPHDRAAIAVLMDILSRVWIPLGGWGEGCTTRGV